MGLAVFSNKKVEAEVDFSQERLSELMLTRFTHDMAGPISAVGNGLELLGDEGSIESNDLKIQALELVRDSAKQSFARLQAYRIAYGVIYQNVFSAKTVEVKNILDEFYRGSQIKINFDASVPEETSMIRRRALVNMVLIVGKALIYGGNIKIEFEGENKNILKITSESKKFKAPNVIKEILFDKNNHQPDVETAPYFFFRECCKAAKTEINFDYLNGDETKKIEFVTSFQNNS